MPPTRNPSALEVVVKALAVVAGAILGIYLLWRVRGLVVPVVVGGLLAYICGPLVAGLERYRITRRMLEVFERHPQHGLFILTKQPLVERDRDILARLPRAGVGMSISIMRDDLAQVIEPWAPVTSERLAIIKRLSAAGIATYILWAPAFVPVRMTERFVLDSIEAIARSGARALSLDALNYRSRQPAGLTRRLAREGHAPATKAQIELIQSEADRRGLGRRLELAEPESIEELEPMLPF